MRPYAVLQVLTRGVGAVGDGAGGREGGRTMYLGDLGTSLRRRWRVALAGLAVTAGLCATAAAVVPPTYEAQASVVLLPPAGSAGEGGNPYLQLQGLSQVVDVLTRAMTSQTTVDAVKTAAPTGKFDVAPDWATSGPILIVHATAPSAEVALATMEAALAQVPSKLHALQAALGISQGSQITSLTLTQTAEAKTVQKTRIRAVIAVAGLGLAVSAFVVSLVDSLLLRRSRRRTASGPPPRVAQAPPGPALPRGKAAAVPRRG